MPETITILCVDDDEDDYLLARELLLATPGRHYEIDWAASLAGALEALDRKVYDLFLVDYYLGAATGVEFMQAAAARGCEVPSIILTGQDNLTADLAAQEAGAIKYLSKNDLTVRLLDRAVRYVMKRAQTARLGESTGFLRSVLDALPYGLAVIDRSGEIHLVNEAWNRVDGEGGFRWRGWVGQNYLTACDLASVDGDRAAGDIAEAVRSVLDRRRDSYAGEFPFQGGGRRWFTAITRIERQDLCWAVVTHRDITEKRFPETHASGERDAGRTREITPSRS